jgi:hypothetical protein
VNRTKAFSIGRNAESRFWLLVAAAIIAVAVLAGCTTYERNNPFDPANPSSQRDLTPAVLSFVYNDGSGDSAANAEKAYAAYRRITPPALVLSFDVPLSGALNSALDFLKNHWEIMNGPRPLPRVFVGSDMLPLQGIATSGLHLDSIDARLAPLRGRTAFWTIEGEASVTGGRTTLTITVARLGRSPAQSMRVLAFAGDAQTSSWIKVAHVFDEQSIGQIKESEIVNLTFSGSLGSEAPAGKPVYAVILVGTDGHIEQGVRFE